MRIPDYGSMLGPAILILDRDPLWFQLSEEFPVGPSYGPLPSLKGSEPLAHVLKVVYNGIMMVLQGFRIRGPYHTIPYSTIL